MVEEGITTQPSEETQGKICMGKREDGHRENQLIQKHVSGAKRI